MEFLFTGQIASIEALIVFACILIVFGIFGYEGYLSLREYLGFLFPKRGLPTITPSQSIESTLPSQVLKEIVPPY